MPVAPRQVSRLPLLYRLALLVDLVPSQGPTATGVHFIGKISSVYALTLWCVVLLFPRSLAAQDAEVRAYRIPATASDAIRIDGRLSEDVWSLATPLTGFRQREPEEGDAATERTEVRIAYDDVALYIGVLAFDSRPDDIVARILQRDKLFEPDRFGSDGLQAAGDDAVAILLDPFHDHRSGVVFATNPNGAEFEALLTDEGSGVNIDWRAVWEVASTRTPEGWSAEFAIPWRTLRYPDASGDEPWGINVFRVIRRKNEQTLWQGWEREGGGLHRVSSAGHLTGLVDLPRQGINIEVKPSVLAGRRQEADDVGVIGSSNTFSTGLDLKAEVRPGLLLDLTVNTDFAQVEVDDAQVNLTRFDLFFPEKRDFFLENSGIFDFGTGDDPFGPPAYQMFFSRQIGISDDGEVPILAGARLTGRVGRQTVGFLNVITDDVAGVDQESFSVARVKRDVGESDYVGAMVVDRRGDGPTNTSVGIDGQFLIGEAWIWDMFAARSFTEGPGGDGYSYKIGYSYRGDVWSSFLDHFGVSAGAEAGAGFITRTDFRSTDLFAGRTWRPSALGLREVQLFVGSKYATTISDGRLQDWSTGFFLSPKWESSDEFTLFANASETVVDEGFELSGGVDIPVGRYRADHIGWFAGTSSARALSLGSTGMISKFFGGSLVSVGGTVTAAPSPQIAFELGYNRNSIDVPSGSFTAEITSLRATYSVSTRMSTNVLVQYNSLERAFSTNVRFNFIHRPGSDFFIVFTENRGTDDRVWQLSDRGLVMKLTYLMRM